MRRVISGVITLLLIQPTCYAGLTTEDSVTAKKISTPANPASGYTKMYFKSNDKLYSLTSAGTEALISSFDSTNIDTSAELKAILTDETGSGALVFAESPTLVTPALGTPASGVMTNVTGTAAGLTAGLATDTVSKTGTGSTYATNTSPTFVTPVLGVASATSIAYTPVTMQSSSWSGSANRLATQGNTSAQAVFSDLYTKDGDGTDDLGYTLFAKGSPSSIANYEVLEFRYDNAARAFKFDTIAGGSGTILPLIFYTSGNDNQLYLETTGDIGIGTSNPDQKLEINLGTTKAFRLTYNDSNGSAANYSDFTVSSSGDLTLTPSGGDTIATGVFQTTSNIELGHATDTTLSRSAAGVVQVEGVTVPTISSTNTFTNKRITKRSQSTAGPGATPTINTDNVDVVHLTALATAITSMTTNLTGTPVEGDILRIDFTDDGTGRAITWGASFEASTVPLPTTTVANARLDVVFHWNTATSKWRCVGVA